MIRISQTMSLMFAALAFAALVFAASGAVVKAEPAGPKGLTQLNQAVLLQGRNQEAAPAEAQPAASVLAIPKVKKLLEMDFRRLLAWSAA